ncbi:MAG: CoB--CoM heterodisulfide reductase iron-sulfur subunit B family protein [Phycisphaerae bacterium]|nr:CoB--CoM heterodisulfide reductase iron-sulfur subunit B family protein [Phycisphaerae bacterium]
MKIAYFPGCSLHSTGAEFDVSTRKVCEAMDVQLCEVKDWTCCGSSPAHQCDELMSVALPARILALTTETEGLREVCAPCASCYSRLKFAQDRLGDPKWRADIEAVVGRSCPDDIGVYNMLDLVSDKVGLEAVAAHVVKPLAGLKVACYYGCLLTRPPKIVGGANHENPSVMESIMETIGAESLDWNLKTFCCGAGFALTKTEVVLELTRKVLADAVAVGAEAIVVACPLCHANLDGRQEQINTAFGADFHVPIFYFTQLMGMAFGIAPGQLAIGKHLTDVSAFLKERALL